jgi:hypothetical protein
LLAEELANFKLKRPPSRDDIADWPGAKLITSATLATTTHLSGL